MIRPEYTLPPIGFEAKIWLGKAIQVVTHHKSSYLQTIHYLTTALQRNVGTAVNEDEL